MNRYKLILLIIIFFGIHISYSKALDFRKEIIGTWQENDSVISAGYQNLFRFYKDGKVTFHVSDYNNISIIRSVEGEYKINKDSIYLKILYVNKFLNGTVRFGEFNDIDDMPLVFEGDSLTKENIKEPYFQPIPYKIELKKRKSFSIDIGGFIYYKLNDDPYEE
ncbi:MAG: hypothetical protein HZB41_03790 [Ignavibacteriae bacterium]|nr:hypothetical protein [Ignavibacteriota bacterium]